MSVYKRGKVYWYDFWFNGERHNGSTKLRNETKAKMVEAKLRTDLAMGSFGMTQPRTSPVLKAFLEGDFLNAVRDRSKQKPRTVKFYEEKVRRLVEHDTLAALRLHQIDEKVIEEHSQWRAARKRRSHGDGVPSVASINGELRALRHALNLAKEWKLLSNIPKIRIRPGERRRDFVLTYDMEKAYLATVQYPLREAAILMLDCGLRPDECVRLRKEDVSLAEGYLRVRTGKTKNAARAIPFPVRSKETLQLLFDFWPESEWVFAGQRRGKPLTVWALDNMHSEARANTTAEDGTPLFPKEFVVYSLRHTFGTRLGESGADAFAIMTIMGHSSITVSQLYVHPSSEHISRTMAQKSAMDALVRDGVPAKVPQEDVKTP